MTSPISPYTQLPVVNVIRVIAYIGIASSSDVRYSVVQKNCTKFNTPLLFFNRLQ